MEDDDDDNSTPNKRPKLVSDAVTTSPDATSPTTSTTTSTAQVLSGQHIDLHVVHTTTSATTMPICSGQASGAAHATTDPPTINLTVTTPTYATSPPTLTLTPMSTRQWYEGALAVHGKNAAGQDKNVRALPVRKRSGGQVGNRNAAGKHTMIAGSRSGMAGPPRRNINAEGHGAPRRNINAEGHGPPLRNINAEGHHGAGAGPPQRNINAEGHHGAGGPPQRNINAEGHHGAGGPPIGSNNAQGPHQAAKETQQQIEYDDLIDDFQRKASCADDPFHVPMNEKMQSDSLKNIAKDLKRATRIVACTVCGTSQFESDTKLMHTTMDLPPPESWSTHLKTTQNSILIENSPDLNILRDQYRLPLLEGMHPGWQELLLCKQGLYQVTSPEDAEIADMFVYPRGSFMDMHVGHIEHHSPTPASLAKACVCKDCETSLQILPRKPQGCLPQLAIANDLVIGARSLFTK